MCFLFFYAAITISWVMKLGSPSKLFISALFSVDVDTSIPIIMIITVKNIAPEIPRAVNTAISFFFNYTPPVKIRSSSLERYTLNSMFRSPEMQSIFSPFIKRGIRFLCSYVSTFSNILSSSGNALLS